MSGLARLKSQMWSAETLLRGIGKVTDQPQQQLSMSPMDPELRKEFEAVGYEHVVKHVQC